MQRWIPIRHRDFWDVPRIFLAADRGSLFLFDCPFDEETEDYPDYYLVYLLPDLADTELQGSWADLSAQATRFLGRVPISQVLFDESRRQAIDSRVLTSLTSAAQAS